MSWLLGVTLSTQALLVLSLFTARLHPGLRIWPPPSWQSWRLYFTWGGTWVHLSGAFLLTVLDWNSLQLSPAALLGAGVPLIALGQSLIFWGFRSLSLHTTLGSKGPLVRHGPYEYSRNPQYVGACIYLAGLALVSGSHPAMLACAGGTGWFLLAPLAEEPWLRSQLGAEYESYCRQVPRFLRLRPRATAAAARRSTATRGRDGTPRP